MLTDRVKAAYIMAEPDSRSVTAPARAMERMVYTLMAFTTSLTLPKTCTFYFPSTNIRLEFQSLVDEADPPDQKIACSNHVGVTNVVTGCRVEMTTQQSNNNTVYFRCSVVQ